MSMAQIATIAPGRWRNIGLRLAALLAALAFVGALLAILGWLLTPDAPAAAAKNPFGLKMREAPASYSGLGGFIIAAQAQFYALLTSSVTALKSGEEALWGLVLVGFAYGVFHAAGPGHGKGVIAAYVLARRRSALCSVGLSLGAALLQACVAIALVGLFRVIASSVAMTLGDAARGIELMSFAGLMVFGLYLLWKKSDCVLPQAQGRSGETFVVKAPSRFEAAGVIAAAGIRPCSGAILLLVFSSSVGLFWQGVAGALAMALGTAITTSAIGLLASLARRGMSRLGRTFGGRGAMLVEGAELCAAAFVCLFGAILLSGMSGAGLPNLID
jgi:nickel/cobalt exporter